MSPYDFDYDDGRWDKERVTKLVASYEQESGEAFFDSEALEEIAAHYYEVGEIGKSLSVVDHLLEQQPFSSDAWLRRAMLLGHQGRGAEALAALNQARSINPADSETLLSLAATLDVMHRSEEALEC